MQTIIFRTATVTIEGKLLKTTFPDGKVNDFYFDDWIHERVDYIQTARDMGYASYQVEEYAVEHELAHHFIADNLGWRNSFAVWEDKWHPEPWPAHIAWEEHLVNRFQRYTRTAQLDEYGVLQKVFDSRLNKLATDFIILAELVHSGTEQIIYGFN